MYVGNANKHDSRERVCIAGFGANPDVSYTFYHALRSARAANRRKSNARGALCTNTRCTQHSTHKHKRQGVSSSPTHTQSRASDSIA